MASPRDFAAAGAPGDLREQLKRPLGGAEIGEPETDVGGDDADERHPRKVVSFGDHLGADEHVDLAGGESAQQRGIAPRLRIVSRSTRATRTPGNNAGISASTRSVPKPSVRGTARRSSGTPSEAASSNCSSDSVPAAPPVWTVSDTLQFGHSSVAAH